MHRFNIRLKGQFSRIDFKLSVYGHGQTNVVKSFKAVLPPGVSDVYYKDVVGNISTSNLRPERKQTILEFQPRYPLYGGWKFSWFYGYTMPQAPTLTPTSKEGEFKFKATFVPTLANLVVDKSTIKIILPEGAENIKISSPIAIDEELQYLTFTYFDTTGRPTVVLTKNNIVDEFDDYPIQVTIFKTHILDYLQLPFLEVLAKTGSNFLLNFVDFLCALYDIPT